MKDSERVGIMIQLFNKTWSCFTHQFLVEGNREFTELLQMNLFALDSLFDFYKDQTFNEPLLACLFDPVVRVINTLN